MQVAVLGGTGRTGVPLVERALERGHRVRVLARDRAIRRAMQLMQPELLEDGQAAVAAVTASDLDWTVVRFPRFTDGERRGRIRTDAHVGGDTGTTLGRGDLAVFLLDELEGPAWSGRSPVVSW